MYNERCLGICEEQLGAEIVIKSQNFTNNGAKEEQKSYL
jgi:hypothetical protein